jgi:hypothetical protein
MKTNYQYASNAGILLMLITVKGVSGAKVSNFVLIESIS